MFETQSVEIQEYIKKYASNPISFLLISGPNGTGKSYAAKLIYEKRKAWYIGEMKKQIPNHCLMDKYQGFIINQADLNDKFNLEHKDGFQGELLEFLKQTSLLILDDLGTRTPSQAFGDLLYAVMDYRFENRQNCATVITTNLNHDDMRKQFGDPFVSRIASTKCFRFEGKDSRFKQF
jgi:DNA replication protein DnaC